MAKNAVPELEAMRVRWMRDGCVETPRLVTLETACALRISGTRVVRCSSDGSFSSGDPSSYLRYSLRKIDVCGAEKGGVCDAWRRAYNGQPSDASDLPPRRRDVDSARRRRGSMTPRSFEVGF